MKDYNITKLTPTTVGNIYDVSMQTTPDSYFTSGAQAVAQQFIKILLTTQGTDKMQTSLGANLYRYLTGSPDVDDPFFKMEVQRMIAEAKDQMIEYQDEEDTDENERLLSATLLDIFMDERTNSVVISIRIQTEAGNALDVDIPPPNTSRLL